ncbi:uncharacterized protein MONOS_501 [Monocercomonoides exilis]|uniref:uncharacterized protein n=1 Tax=Monocercomonoides exilis TaxID=2049356 RepID=UPI00355A1818|nr:hypothetical protein MONOS_501 [Monocercomonoides exilis]|eukprot:MONOS_501.1-p1 / transcript=MONOS_501.1 / gene=MONOS_501 / organism=Monocercomonoides_exilis_PA203 / gene_product=unspecified product / transcript_product=unspecified product / location=Mono_scaffold00008:48974-49744(-) / protein_length=201 / sequence_SO=supercontig / SO=protein_coding / is_pseudo=false
MSHAVSARFGKAKLSHSHAPPPVRVVVHEIYLGPVHCGIMEMKPGIVRQATSSSEPYEHPFIDLKLVHIPTQRKILAILDLSTDSFDFQHRLLSEGFDLAAPSPEIEKKPIGRCWRLISHSKELLGALWDTPGRLGSLTSGLSVSTLHPQAMMTLYFSADDPLFQALVRLYESKTKTLADLRRGIENLGIDLSPTLYSLF